MLTKNDLEHLAELARIDFQENESEKLQKDLGAILDYFKELQELNTDGIAPMTGGTELKNVLREDVSSQKSKVPGPWPGRRAGKSQKGAEAFPDKQDGYLRVPPVF